MKATDPLVVAALITQEEERADGYFSGNPSIREIQRQLTPDALLALVRELRRADRVPHRELAARLLEQGPVPGPRVTDEVRCALRDEEDPAVISWLVIALQYGRDPRALPDVKRLADHSASEVRFSVPDALTGTATRFRDAGDLLLQLSNDPERDVRWSAAFELASWLGGTPDQTTDEDATRILTRLREIAQSELDPDIRASAAQAIADWETTHGEHSP